LLEETTMRIQIISLLMALFIPACVQDQGAGAEQARQRDLSKFAGVWRGQFDGLPGVDLVINDEGDQLHGAVLFYLHIRPDVHSPYTSTPGLPEPMFDLKLEEQTLKFEVSHRHAHPPRTLHDPPMAFQLKLIGPDKAELVNESEGDGPRVVLTRSDY
jgi:hypothetical protein